jgi:hypothetical protein
MKIIPHHRRCLQRPPIAHHKVDQNVYIILLLAVSWIKKKLFLVLGGFKTQDCCVLRSSFSLV